MRNTYVYDVIFQRWKDRDQELKSKYAHMPGENSFPMELRHTTSNAIFRDSKPIEGELPSSSQALPRNSVEVIDELWPSLPTVYEAAKDAMHEDIFKAETLVKL